MLKKMDGNLMTLVQWVWLPLSMNKFNLVLQL